MTTACQASEVYLVPRNGTIESVTVADRDDLRRLRTELEILRRVARKAASVRLIQPERSGADPELGDELFTALKDAANPLVDEVVARIDGNHPGLKNDIFLPVVNEEAENIMQEAIERGIARPLVSVSGGARRPAGPTTMNTVPPRPGPFDPPPVEQSLARAERDLAGAVRAAQARAPHQRHCKEAPADPHAGSLNQNACMTTQNAHRQPAADDHEESALPHEETASAGDSSRETELDEYLTANTRAHEEKQASDAPPAANDAFARSTADKAKAALEQIQRGIHRLTHLLNCEVNTCWKQAQDAFRNVKDVRTKAATLRHEATQTVHEIARLKKEIEIARDDVDAASLEAKRLREEALCPMRQAQDAATTTAMRAGAHEKP